MTRMQLNAMIEAEMDSVLNFSGQADAPDVHRLKSFARQVAARVARDAGVLAAEEAASQRADASAASLAKRHHREWCKKTGNRF